jgi:hypothetical protein
MDKCKGRERKKKDKGKKGQVKRTKEGSEGREYEKSNFSFKIKYAHTLKVTII